MNTPIRESAYVSTARGCGFAALAIVTSMVGLSGHPPSAFKFGGYATLLMALVLILKALRADYVPYKRTEIWLLLPEQDRPPPVIAQTLITRVRREVFLRFARINAGLAALCFLGWFLSSAWLAV